MWMVFRPRFFHDHVRVRPFLIQVSGGRIVIGTVLSPLIPILKKTQYDTSSLCHIRRNGIGVVIAVQYFKVTALKTDPCIEARFTIQVESDRLFSLFSVSGVCGIDTDDRKLDRKSTRLNSSHYLISYAVFCLKKKNSMPSAA